MIWDTKKQVAIKLLTNICNLHYSENYDLKNIKIIKVKYFFSVCIPVYCGVAVLHAWQAQPLCAFSVYDKIRNELTSQLSSDIELTDDILENIAGLSLIITF